ncbi:uncharacterized protein LOC129907854 [Episyrphus balteatus]|uniref:uncharacterized protein LOC129907854 n=1 Tax=Episyrphus balteatus TaxID=286459 RepID=UPI0024865043|nr:uncharacterized protein LOC129907854 [Episyrphus balteatus]
MRTCPTAAMEVILHLRPLHEVISSTANGTILRFAKEGTGTGKSIGLKERDSISNTTVKNLLDIPRDCMIKKYNFEKNFQTQFSSKAKWHSLDLERLQSGDIAGTSKGAPATAQRNPTATKPTATTVDMGGKRRRIFAKPNLKNLPKRRSQNPSVELPTKGGETARTAKTEGAAKIQEQMNNSPVEEEFNYMSDGGEGHYTTGDSNNLADHSSPEPSSDEEEEEEQTLQTKINEFERKMDALRQEVAPLIQLMKAKQEARRAKEKQELADKEAAKAANAAQQQQEQLRLQQQQVPQPQREQKAPQHKQQAKQQQRQQQQQLPAQVAQQQQLHLPTQVPEQQQEQPQQQHNRGSKPSGSKQQVRTQQQQAQEQQRGRVHQQQPQTTRSKKENVPPINVFKWS